MKLSKGHLKKKSVIEKTAAHFGNPPEEVQKEIKEIIDITWASDDPQVKAYQQQYFPTGKPTPEEFITVIAKTIKQHSTNPIKQPHFGHLFLLMN